ncbi:MAG: YraN family protein [Candidatus Nealsonbacteria bacterium CG_4_9_14_0_2_um_filter_37_38]|uniref:UPF0102 protein COY73_02415 n=1 Tax=Candidatus Nealsonbacteria bacterium CG_4_10_14_0_8_um_filter_37_14 TaxID=1974684 RepID=A0A2M7R794_9BACT|nr:MAG: YraN family protein [Candidatus Nealsonbacteria bacterium CG11_big_fil_rev_8_21_14_0_20_37_68]PIW92336.1 MAG: YraN family protein [Candidatus Nealsonbacteria bacterium CG_4_8_14_3_um_filter_37_23]PIY88943.1 MAG: YraN family protein [Candidatus Nealsonbacteria bacterium CG_4_10_14_0_8_um_filter_37_14]PJC51458.1 MAG: YraN family protein [Candidatus Nealsonbacteria bacterium CG_4_9_14_0_2_um_filter_37_38]
MLLFRYMTISRQKLGQFGERIAEDFLKRKGYKILDRNFFVRSAFGPKTGEIDIVAKKDDAISFVEVKTVLASSVSPEQKVNFQKQRKLIKMAQIWLMKNKIPLNKKWQIDIIAIKIDLNIKKAKIRHFKNAVSG